MDAADGLLIKLLQHRLVLQLCIPQGHQKLMLRAPGDLTRGKANVDKTLAQRARHGPLENRQIFFRFIFWHHRDTAGEAGDDLAAAGDIAAVNFRDIILLRPQAAAQLAQFLVDHGASPYSWRRGRGKKYSGVPPPNGVNLAFVPLL